jgi:branched-chain amino acid transport system permease protein
MNADQALQFLIGGLTVGAIYALVALGFTIIYNVTGIINFAQGEFVMLGALLLYSFSDGSGGLGLPLILAVPLAVVATTLVGLALERLGIRPARSASIVALIIVTIGASLALRGAAQLTWGKDALPVQAFSGEGVVPIGGAVVSRQSLWVLTVTLVVMAALYLFFNRTLLGRAVLACGINRYGATLIGIDARQVSLLSFGLSAALGALGGALIASISLASPEMGVVGLKGFSAAVIGGLGSSPGAVLGGLVLGILEAFAAGYVSSAYKDAIAFVILLAALLVRPEGILGVRSNEVHSAGPVITPRRGTSRRAGRMRVNWTWVLVSVLVLALPLTGNNFLVNLGVFVGLFTLVASGLGLLMGYTGQISLGQAAFMGLGAYSSAIFTTRLDFPPVLALVVGVALSVLIALVVGWQVFKLTGHYLALGTLAFGIVVAQVFDQWEPVTHGAAGILNIPRLGVGNLTMRGDLAYYYLVWPLALVVILGTLNLVDSRVGRALRAVASSEPGAESLGVHSAAFKVKVFVLSAALASISGSLYAHFLGFIDPAPFGFAASLSFVIMAVLGGTATVWGPPFGALVIVLLSQALQQFRDWNTLANGLVLMAIMMFLPQGVVRGVGELLAGRGPMRLRQTPRAEEFEAQHLSAREVVS